LSFELGKRGVQPPVSESAAYRALARLNLVDPAARPRDRKWKRWERGTAMELWQMDVVGGFALADGTRAEALTGVDDHSRFCVSAHRRRCALTVSRSGRQRGACSPSFGYRVGDCLVPGDLPITPGVEVGL
jgi:hypothetical protein